MKQITPSSLLAHAYLFSTRTPRPLFIIKMLCYIGIGVGSCALMLALSITQGFEHEIGLKMKGINSDVVIESPGNQLDASQLRSYLADQESISIQGISASSTRHIIANHEGTSHILFLRGITGSDEEKTTTLHSKILAPRMHTLEHLLAGKHAVLIGKQCALTHKLWIGSELEVFIPQEAGKSKIGLEKQTMIVAGIFSLGMEEYDANVAYCSRETLCSFFPNCTGADHIALSFNTPDWMQPPTTVFEIVSFAWQRMIKNNESYCAVQTQKVAALLPGLSVRSWRELYPDLVASLHLEKYALSIVLGLIAFVASMLMICLLFMFIQHKHHDIAILSTLGMSKRALYWLFVRIGMTIVTRAVVIGVAIACCAAWVLQTYKCVQLPAVYYVSYLPAHIEPLHVLIVIGGTLLLGFIACHIPLRQLKNLSIVSILRGA